MSSKVVNLNVSLTKKMWISIVSVWQTPHRVATIHRMKRTVLDRLFAMVLFARNSTTAVSSATFTDHRPCSVCDGMKRTSTTIHKYCFSSVS